jgi:hypothetical protein
VDGSDVARDIFLQTRYARNRPRNLGGTTHHLASMTYLQAAIKFNVSARPSLHTRPCEYKLLVRLCLPGGTAIRTIAEESFYQR